MTMALQLSPPYMMRVLAALRDTKTLTSEIEALPPGFDQVWATALVDKLYSGHFEGRFGSRAAELSDPACITLWPALSATLTMSTTFCNQQFAQF